MPTEDAKKKKGRSRRSTPAPWRVAELDENPSLDQLYQAFESARNQQETTVELVFRISEQESSYLLTVICPEDQGVLPSWELFSCSRDGGRLNSSWTYTGDDVALIHEHLKALSASSFIPVHGAQGAGVEFGAASVKIDTLQTFPFAHVGLPHKAAVLEADPPFYSPVAKDFPTLRKQHELLLQPETGIFAQWSMMYFLEQEYYRFKACNYPVVLALYDFGVEDGGKAKPVPASYIKQIGQRISRAKRRIDIFGHFGTTICALMLPHTEFDAGSMVAERIKKIILDDAQNRGLPFFIRMGVAGIPIQANDVNTLINEAAERMR